MDVLIPPFIFFLQLPEKEQPVAASIVENLRALASYERAFQNDLALFDFAYDQKNSDDYDASAKALAWMFIAGRDGAMMLYHVGMTLRAFGGLLARAPTLAKLVDTHAVEASKHAFEGHFKDFYAVRQGVAHLADHSVTPDRREKHAIKKSSKHVIMLAPRLEDGSIAEVEGPGFYARNNFSGRTFWGTVENESVQYDLSQDSLEKLREVIAIIYGAFQRAQNETQRRHEGRGESQQPPSCDESPQPESPRQ